MGHYGAGTTCKLCGCNHPTRTNAITCADIYWKRAGYAGFVPAQVITEDGETITHEPTPLATCDEILDLEDMPIEVWSAYARETIRAVFV